MSGSIEKPEVGPKEPCRRAPHLGLKRTPPGVRELRAGCVLPIAGARRL